MAKKESKEKDELERAYNIPMRKEFQKAPLYKRAKKAGTALKEFIAKHMKVDIKDINVSRYLNMKLWEKGIKSPPHHVKVNLKKFSDGRVEAELVGAPVDKKEEKKSVKEQIMQSLMADGLANNEVSAQIIAEHMSDAWAQAILDDLA